MSLFRRSSIEMALKNPTSLNLSEDSSYSYLDVITHDDEYVVPVVDLPFSSEHGESDAASTRGGGEEPILDLRSCSWFDT
ncbi:hypothetical protein PTKIN_Ptkin04bG0101200 [Pterospermum kingtungense]